MYNVDAEARLQNPSNPEKKAVTHNHWKQRPHRLETGTILNTKAINHFENLL